MAELDHILVTGAREHNLKDLTVRIPKKRLVVCTGVSGSGKSSLAFDTLYAEGQRRYVESLSAYARQFLGQMEKPHYDHIRGLAPTISIEQKAASRNPRSTVGTITEIHDYLRVLYARVGEQHCPGCGRPVTGQTPERIADELQLLPEGQRFLLLAPLVAERKGEHRDLLTRAAADGFVRARVNGELVATADPPQLDRRRKHSVELVVDRLVGQREHRQRLVESVESAVAVGGGECVVSLLDGKGKATEDRRFSTRRACTSCRLSFGELTPQTFSFNSPLGMCTSCNGIGLARELDPRLLVPDPGLSLLDGAVVTWRQRAGSRGARWWLFRWLRDGYGIPLDRPWRELTQAQRRIVLYGSSQERRVTYRGRRSTWSGQWAFEGLIPRIKRLMHETRSERQQRYYASFLAETPCPDCEGGRLRPEAAAVRLGERSLPELCELTVVECLAHLLGLELQGSRQVIASELLKEICARLSFLEAVGLGYLALSRPGPSLSGGESQRIRLASQVGSELTGVIYILDEPTIGLHQRDNQRLLKTLKRMRDIGNTVVVVEHDAATMRAADHIIDFGPGAGRLGGEIVFSGSPAALMRSRRSLTGRYLSGREVIALPEARRPPGEERLQLLGARANNLKDVTVEIPLGLLTCITGVSGAGKSSLLNQTLYPALARRLQQAEVEAGPHDGLEGLEHLDKVINIDQKPIGRTPRSNPVTYAKVFDHIRDLFAQLPEARRRGYPRGRFSFNVKGGRCERCQGDGLLRIEMHFLADVFVPCEECKGKRFNEQTLQVRYKGKHIAEVLDLSVEEGMELFAGHRAICRILQTLVDVGLGYLAMGQPSPTLSGGEAQRIKLARELARRATGRTIYFLDEPTTGLHFHDVRNLLGVLQRLVDAGNTVVVIEHNLDVVKTADWIIDLGPEGGEAGGEVVVAGPPELVARTRRSHTGRYLREGLAGAGTTTPRRQRRAARAGT